MAIAMVQVPVVWTITRSQEMELRHENKLDRIRAQRSQEQEGQLQELDRYLEAGYTVIDAQQIVSETRTTICFTVHRPGAAGLNQEVK